MILNDYQIDFDPSPTRIQFDADDYAALHALVFREDYPHKPPPEIPNGDGNVDRKSYRHVALKYLPGFGNAAERDLLLSTLYWAHLNAESVYDALGGPPAFRPDIRYGALRVLEYAPGDFSHEHTDFDLFTLALYRDRPDHFHRQGEWTDLPTPALALNHGLHLGELGEAIGLGKATRHSVSASTSPQRSIVYFAIPDHEAQLPEGNPDGSTISVRNWLNERMARSRTAFTPYRKEGV